MFRELIIISSQSHLSLPLSFLKSTSFFLWNLNRKCGLLLNNAIAILGATLMSSSHLFRSVECLFMGRFAIGLSCGLNTALVPM